MLLAWWTFIRKSTLLAPMSVNNQVRHAGENGSASACQQCFTYIRRLAKCVRAEEWQLSPVCSLLFCFRNLGEEKEGGIARTRLLSYHTVAIIRLRIFRSDQHRASRLSALVSTITNSPVKAQLCTFIFQTFLKGLHYYTRTRILFTHL